MPTACFQLDEGAVLLKGTQANVKIGDRSALKQDISRDNRESERTYESIDLQMGKANTKASRSVNMEKCDTQTCTRWHTLNHWHRDGLLHKTAALLI